MWDNLYQKKQWLINQIRILNNITSPNDKKRILERAQLCQDLEWTCREIEKKYKEKT